MYIGIEWYESAHVLFRFFKCQSVYRRVIDSFALEFTVKQVSQHAAEGV